MKFKALLLGTALAIGSAAISFAQDSEVPQRGPAANGEPAWFILQQNRGAPPAAAPAPAGGQSTPAAAPGRGGRAGGGRGAAAIPEICAADFAKWCSGSTDGMRCLQAHSGEVINNCRVAVSGQRFR